VIDPSRLRHVRMGFCACRPVAGDRSHLSGADEGRGHMFRGDFCRHPPADHRTPAVLRPALITRHKTAAAPPTGC